VQQTAGQIAQNRALELEAAWAVRDAEARQRRLTITVRANATPEEELERAEYAVKIAQSRQAAAQEAIVVATANNTAAKARQQQAQADLDTYLAGAWKPDVVKAEALVAEAKARVQRLEQEIARRQVLAPRDATVLRVNLRKGEFVVAGSSLAESAVMVLGDVSAYHVRVDIDEFDLPRFKPGTEAVAFYKGDGRIAIPLEFVRLEPFVIPKRALTNSQRELVDTRVLQVIYKITDNTHPVYVGQQMDVFIKAAPPAPTVAAQP